MTLRLERYRPNMSEEAKALIDQRRCEAIEQAFNTLGAAVAAIAAAQAAADAANTAATNAQTVADDVTAATTLQGSWVSGCTITATDVGASVTISISAHTRHYPQTDGTTVDVAVNAGSLTGKAYSTTYYITYTDPTRAGGAVAYTATTTEPAQIGDLHVVGSVLTPAAAAPPTPGGVVRAPGTGTINA